MVLLFYGPVIPCAHSLFAMCCCSSFSESIDDDDEVLVVLAEQLGALLVCVVLSLLLRCIASVVVVCVSTMRMCARVCMCVCEHWGERALLSATTAVC